MKTIKWLAVNLVLVTLFAAGTANASLVQYQMSGEVVGAFRPVIDDPIADLLGVTRNAQNNIAYQASLVIDTGSTPTIEQDTSILQQFKYTNSIISAKLILNNNTVLETQRDPFLGSDTNEINVLNRIDPKSIDIFSGSLGQPSLPGGDLFNSYLVPFNQTIKGVLYENATVQLDGLSFQFIGSNGNGLFNDASIPTDANLFDPIPTIASFSIGLRTELGGRLQLGNLSGINTLTISPVTVPVPAAFWLFLSGIGLLHFNPRGYVSKTKL